AAAGLVAVLQPRRRPPRCGHHRRPRPALGLASDPPPTGGDGAGLGPAARPFHGFGASAPPDRLPPPPPPSHPAPPPPPPRPRPGGPGPGPRPAAFASPGPPALRVAGLRLAIESSRCAVEASPAGT